MKISYIPIVVALFLMTGCTDQDRLRQLEADKTNLTSRVAFLESELTRYKNLDTAVFAEIPETKDDSNISTTAKALDDFISRFPRSPLVSDAKSRLREAQLIIQRQAEKQVSLDKERGLFRSLLDVKSDQPRYVGKLIRVNAEISISTYFNYGYRDAQSTHLAFRISDGTADANVYGSKNWDGAEKLRDDLLVWRSRKMCVRYIIYEHRYAQSGDIHAELMGYGPIEDP